MCGIVGLVSNKSKLLNENSAFQMESMIDKLKSRGPDDRGIWHSSNRQIIFGHTRLSIQDLSLSGHQPMHSKSGRYTIVFNGEIYNHLDLRSKLNISWSGHSDTETILALIDQFGINKTLQAIVGMFAFAVFDNIEGTLYLTRDRLGEKPMYYGWLNSKKDKFVFASDLSAIKINDEFERSISKASICQFLRHNYIASPNSIYENIYKLEPGTILCFDTAKFTYSVSKYWDILNIASSIGRSTFSENEWIERLEELIFKSVKKSLISDVTVGAFLSGGVDSSLIASIMQKCQTNSVKTFTIGFDDPSFNEAEHAKDIAKYIGSDHTELYVDERLVQEMIYKMPATYSEPFADSSQLPTFIVSELASKNLKVVLSGDGGDELFGGYTRYLSIDQLWNKLNLIPYVIKIFLGRSANHIHPQFLNKIGNKMPSRLLKRDIGDKIQRVCSMLCNTNQQDMYLSLISHFQHPSDWVISSSEPANKVTSDYNIFNNMNFQEKMMILDILTYLPDDILVKIDRAAMANSLETRVPFLDKDIVEFSLRMPSIYKIKDRESKWILKQILNKHIPKKLTDRPKKGFSIPIGKWIRTSLVDWAESLIDRKLLENQGFLDADKVQSMWNEHRNGRRDFGLPLWNILMFQAWLENER